MTDSSLPRGDPAALGFDPQRLANIADAMQAFVDDRRLPNLVTLVARRGQVVHQHACGLLDLDEDVPTDLDTLFRMWSNTKTIAGVATLILYERGLLTLDDPVARFLPEYSDQRVRRAEDPTTTEPARRGITIRDCLANTTGLQDPSIMPSYFSDQYEDILTQIGWIGPNAGMLNVPESDNRERVRVQAQLPLMAHPGERFDYHLGYPALSALLEEASGQRLDELFRDAIFEPLDMHDTGFYLAEGALSRFGACYFPREVDGEMRLVAIEKAATCEKTVGPKREFAAGGDFGGVLTTAGEFARFGQMLLNGGELDGVRILGRKTAALLTANHSGEMAIPITGPGYHWGLGVSVYDGGKNPPPIYSAGTYGWDGAAGTMYFADPSEELLAVCLTQVMGAGTMPKNTYQEDFRRLVYQALV